MPRMHTGEDVIYKFVTTVEVLQATAFLDARTNEVTIATLLFTPQPESYPDIATLLKVANMNYSPMLRYPAM